MVVVFEGMPVDAGVVAVTGDQRLQFGRGAGQVLDVESNVLAQAGGPGGTAARPTAGKMPERTAQYFACSAGSSVKRAGT